MPTAGAGMQAMRELARKPGSADRCAFDPERARCYAQVRRWMRSR